VELHDSVAQNLAGVSLQIDAALRNLHVDRDKMIHNLSLASTILKTSREELRNCLWDLRNHALDEQDLNTAIRQTLKPIVDDVKVSINFDFPRNKLSDNTAHAVLRIIRELVANSIRHGKAKNIIIDGYRQKDGIVFSVTDDGCGFDENTVLGPSEGHFGLAGIRERLNALSGKMAIERTIDKCTKITVTLT
jgi:signal transduction histidine kinase